MWPEGRMRQGILALIITLLLVAGLVVGYLGGVASRQTVTTTVVVPCPVVSDQNPKEGATDFTVEVSFQGQWNATVKTYSAFETTPTYLRTTCYYAGSDTAYIYVVPWNSNGEQTVMVMAHKLDSGDGNLTASVGWSAAFRSNSTTSPYGSITAFIGTAP